MSLSDSEESDIEVNDDEATSSDDMRIEFSLDSVVFQKLLKSYKEFATEAIFKMTSDILIIYPASNQDENSASKKKKKGSAQGPKFYGRGDFKDVNYYYQFLNRQHYLLLNIKALIDAAKSYGSTDQIMFRISSKNPSGIAINSSSGMTFKMNSGQFVSGKVLEPGADEPVELSKSGKMKYTLPEHDFEKILKALSVGTSENTRVEIQIYPDYFFIRFNNSSLTHNFKIGNTESENEEQYSSLSVSKTMIKSLKSNTNKAGNCEFRVVDDFFVIERRLGSGGIITFCLPTVE